eukprot:138730-Amphidinium_carterae.3
MIAEMLSKEVVGRKMVLVLAGKLSHMAGLVVYLKPFLGLAPLWAVTADTTKSTSPAWTSRTPRHLIHVKWIRRTLLWLKAFLHCESAAIVRKFRYYEEEVLHIAMDTDTSPYGIGGVLLDVDTKRPTQWFSDEVSKLDERMLKTKRNESAGMPIWEGLAILVGLRAWTPPGVRVRVALRGDCLGVLKAIMRMTSRSPNLNRIIQEVAMPCCLGPSDREA